VLEREVLDRKFFDWWPAIKVIFLTIKAVVPAILGIDGVDIESKGREAAASFLGATN
jgi:hypothetical protein